MTVETTVNPLRVALTTKVLTPNPSSLALIVTGGLPSKERETKREKYIVLVSSPIFIHCVVLEIELKFLVDGSRQNSSISGVMQCINIRLELLRMLLITRTYP